MTPAQRLACLMLLSVAPLAGCHYRGAGSIVEPVPELHTTDESVRAAIREAPSLILAHHGFQARAVPGTGAAPALQMVVADALPQMGPGMETLTGVHRIRVTGAGVTADVSDTETAAPSPYEWRPRFVILPPAEAGAAPPDHVATLAIPTRAMEGDGGEVTVVVEVERINAPVQRIPLLLAYQWVALATPDDATTTPNETARFRPDFVGLTYPIWGLPRDIVDLPFTLLNRMGFGAVVRSKDAKAMPGVFYALAGVTGTVAGAWIGASAGIPAVARTLIYVVGGSFAGTVVGLLAAVGIDYAYGFAGQPAATWLLRSGADDDYKKARTKMTLHGAWDDAELQEYSALRRSWDYFPNWKFIANRREFTTPGEPPQSLVPVIISITEGAEPGE